MTRALAVFDGRAGHWSARFLKSGFKHCFAAIDDGRAWIVIDGRADRLAVSADIPSAFDLARFYRDAGLTVIETERRQPPRRAAPIGPFTCVEAAKRALGLHARAPTPWRLYRVLIEEKERRET